MADLWDLFVVGSSNDKVAESLDGGGLDIKGPVGHGARDAQPWRGDDGHLAAAGAHCSQFLASELSETSESSLCRADMGESHLAPGASVHCGGGLGQ